MSSGVFTMVTVQDNEGGLLGLPGGDPVVESSRLSWLYFPAINVQGLLCTYEPLAASCIACT